jgi:hypothetical protein
MTGGAETASWALSSLSVPPNVNFLGGTKSQPGDYAKRERALGPFNYYSHESSCQGTFIYIVDFAVEWDNRVSTVFIFWHLLLL